MTATPDTTAVETPAERPAPTADRRPRVSPRVAVAIAYLVCAAFLTIYAVRIRSYVWLIDEMLYEKDAVGFAHGALLLPHVHGTTYGPPNGLYPLLLAPAYALFSTPQAFVASHVFGAFAFASTLFPVYLLGRRLRLDWRWALVAAVLSVLVPWSVATLVLMTESVAYPAFMWAILAITVAVAAPGVRSHLLALLAIGVACYARSQFVFLFGVYVASVLAAELTVRDRPWRDRLRPHLTLLAAVPVGLVALLLLNAVAGDAASGYTNTFKLPTFPPGLWASMAAHFAHILVGVGILPAILWLAWLARTALDPVGDTERPHAIVSALAVTATIYQAAFFSQNVAGGSLQERYEFYVVPLLVVGMVALVADARRLAPRVSVVAASVPVALMIGGASFSPLEAPNAFGRVAAASSGFNEVIVRQMGWINDLVPGRPRTPAEVLAATAVVLALVAVAALGSRRRATLGPALCVAVGLWGVVETTWLLGRQVPAINAAVPSGIAGALSTPKDWIDRTVPSGDVAVLPGKLGVPDDASAWLWAEFWNSDVNRAYQLGDRPSYTAFPTRALALDARTGRLAAPEEAPYLVVSPSDPTLRLRGTVAARSTYGPVVLRPQHPYRADLAVTGGFYDGYANGGRPQTVSLYPAAGRAGATRVRLTLEPPPGASVPRLPYTVRAGDQVRRGVLRPGERRRVTVTARPADGGARATVTVASGATVKLADGRRVGVRIAAVDRAG